MYYAIFEETKKQNLRQLWSGTQYDWKELDGLERENYLDLLEDSLVNWFASPNGVGKWFEMSTAPQFAAFQCTFESLGLAFGLAHLQEVGFYNTETDTLAQVFATPPDAYEQADLNEDENAYEKWESVSRFDDFDPLLNSKSSEIPDETFGSIFGLSYA